MVNPIKKARMSSGLTQGEFAKMMGVSQVTACKWEHGKAYPRPKRLKDVANVLGVTVDFLLSDERGA